MANFQHLAVSLFLGFAMATQHDLARVIIQRHEAGAAVRPRQVSDTPSSTSTTSTTSTRDFSFIPISRTTFTPRTASVDTAACTAAASKFVSEVPKPPPELTQFSEEYYKTATRTATATDSECAWYSAIPDSIDNKVADYYHTIQDWISKNGDGVYRDAVAKCRGINGSAPCESEIISYLTGVYIDDVLGGSSRLMGGSMIAFLVTASVALLMVW
jgi:hypothetical protein